MIDLFGLHKDPKDAHEPEPAAAPAPAEKPRAPRGSQSLWGVLLFLDSIFVIVFGGAVAMIASKYWQAPAAPAAIGRRRQPAAKPAKAVETPKPPEPTAAPAAAAKPPIAAKAPAKAEPKPAHRADSPRPPKPSLVNEPPKPHASPSPAAVGATPAADGKARALPVVFKIRAAGAGAVQLVGAFIVRGGRKDMTKGKDGTWTVKLYLNPGQYRYFFFVDKKKTLDPENPRSERGASLVGVP